MGPGERKRRSSIPKWITLRLEFELLTVFRAFSPYAKITCLGFSVTRIFQTSLSDTNKIYYVHSIHTFLVNEKFW